jgi:hypothetical protein
MAQGTEWWCKMNYTNPKWDIIWNTAGKPLRSIKAESFLNTEDTVAYPGVLFWGVQKIQLRTEGRQIEDRSRWPPSQGLRSIYKRVKPVFLLGC